jgi:hypothetical protein
MTDVPWWVLAAPYAGLAGGILYIAWFFVARRSMAEKGLKYFSLSYPLLGIFVVAGSVLNILLGWPPALQTGVALGWILVLATMGVGAMLDAVRRTRQSSGSRFP